MTDRSLADHAQRLLGLVGGEAAALGDTYRGLRAMLASGRPSAADWPVRPTVEVIVGGFRIARELEDLEELLRRDATRLLTGTALDGLARRLTSDRDQRSTDARAIALETVEDAVAWLRDRLRPGAPPAG
jgi:hypothetical protein